MKLYEIVLLSILGLIALIATLLILGKARLRIVCKEKKKLRVVLYVLGIPILLKEDRKKEPKMKDLSHSLFPEATMKRELKRKRRAAAKAMKKRARAEQKKQLRAKRKKAKKAAQKAARIPQPSAMDYIEMITNLLKRLYRVTNGKIQVHIKSLKIAIGTGDAAQTAVLYGVAVQGAAYLLAWLDANLQHFVRDEHAVDVTPDYLSEKTHADIDIVCTIHLSSVLGIALKMLLSYFKQSQRAKQNATDRAMSRKHS